MDCDGDSEDALVVDGGERVEFGTTGLALGFKLSSYSSSVIGDERGRMPLMMYLLSEPCGVLILTVCASALLKIWLIFLMNSPAGRSEVRGVLSCAS